MRKTKISGKDGLEVEAVDGHYKRSLCVATRPQIDFTHEIKFFSNPDNGIDLNKNGAAGGSPEKIFDGTDTSLWGASQLIGTDITFDSTDYAHSGTKSVHSNRSDAGDLWSYAKGSDVNLNNYVSLTIWVYIVDNWGIGDSVSVYGYDSDLGLMVGNQVLLEDYIVSGSYGVWQKASIPLVDLGIDTATTVDDVRFQIISSVAVKPDFYTDDMQFEETTTGIIYTMKPDTGTWAYLSGIKIALADNITGGLSYDKFMGLNALSTGVLFQRWQFGELVFSFPVKQLSDWFQFHFTWTDNEHDDGTNTFISIDSRYTTPEVLRADKGDELRVIVNDDLTDLLLFRMTAGIKVEQR